MSKLMLHDRYAFDDAAKVVITKDGYLTATPRVARTGIQLYYGSELGLTDAVDKNKIFRVFRPEEEVFATDSMASFAYKPVTDDHPPEDVTVENWRKYSRGQMSGDVARDGQFIRVPMAMMDGDLVKKYKDGKKELSVGYECMIEWGKGSAVIDGVQFDYDARQKGIRVNHLAVVDAARGGKDLRIGDGTGARVDLNVYALALEAIGAGKIVKDQRAPDNATHLATDAKGVFAYPLIKDEQVYLESLRANKTDAVTRGDGDALAALDNLLTRAEGVQPNAVNDGKTTELQAMSKILVVDGLSVTVSDEQSGQIIQRALDNAAKAAKDATDRATAAEGKLADATKAHNEATAKATTEMATKDAEITTLKKQVEDAKLTPEKLDQLVKDRAEIAGKARALLGDKLVVDGKSVTDIMRQVVDARLGDKAKGWDESQVRVSFDSLTADVKPAAHTGPSSAQQMQHAFVPGPSVNDSQSRIDARDKRVSEAWKTPTRAA